MDAIADGKVRRPRTAWHCCLEFFAVSTRLPEEYRLPPQEALRLLEEEILPRFDVRQIERECFEDLLRSAERERATGGRIYDAHIAEVARSADVKVVVTDNRRHFASLRAHGVEAKSAEEFVATL
jgi:predicted nucleic acid-binding protein